ncbi:conserved hypothetical protein [Verticillium alfalfae VaMs.102]|uniref:Uncharacterized protein n=1 Tax=Verticillium alfalfae (strain VaMs.102 / ATCC MYA-4576 / FGSC 10136) TaxID=526221 RepID=C9SFY8_VERA1|nr:conserved hypothetical protein [Verticillium alfalfae VaMs.102]EEY17392.1 conserved hypothetical protein [Verticillium alfalfae VaMs.102]
MAEPAAFSPVRRPTTDDATSAGRPGPPERSATGTGTIGTTSTSNRSLVGRVRGASISLINANPQLGMWQATGTAIAQAPNLTELRDPELGGDHIAFNAQGHSTRVAREEPDGELALVSSWVTRRQSGFGPGQQETSPEPIPEVDPMDTRYNDVTAAHGVLDAPEEITNTQGAPEPPRQDLKRRKSLHEMRTTQEKAKWGPTIMNGLKAFWKFFITPSGFLITIYGLNIVAWGAMLFFLLLKAAPAMTTRLPMPTTRRARSGSRFPARSQRPLLRHGFRPGPRGGSATCITTSGPSTSKSKPPCGSWRTRTSPGFAPPAWAAGDGGDGIVVDEDSSDIASTFTGKRAPPTPLWKLGFTIWMMVLNTFLQAVLCGFMWGYNRFDRPVSTPLYGNLFSCR